MDDFSSPEEMALAASVSGFIVSDSSEDTVSSRCTSAEGKAVHPVLSKFQPNLPLCTPHLVCDFSGIPIGDRVVNNQYPAHWAFPLYTIRVLPILVSISTVEGS